MLFRNLAQAAAAVFLSTQVSESQAAVTPRATVCNGFPELCSRSYGNMTFVGAHNSYAVGSDLGANQDQDVTTQLNDGIRLLQVQAHKESTGVKFCHTTCFIHDGGFAVDYFKTVKAWLDKNPNEVVTVLIVNSDNLPSTTWQTVYQTAGIDTVAYVPVQAATPASQWPTLGEMIDSGKRLVTFLDNQADPAQVPYLLDEFSNVWETPFDVTEPSFPCAVNRTSGDPTIQLSLINHFLDRVITIGGIPVPAPDKASLTTTNAATGPGSLGAEVTTCIAAHGRPPNFLLTDFYEFGGGSVFQVAAQINGVTYDATKVSKPAASGGSSQPSTTSTPLNAASSLSLGSLPGWLVPLACVVFGVLVTL